MATFKFQVKAAGDSAPPTFVLTYCRAVNDCDEWRGMLVVEDPELMYGEGFVANIEVGDAPNPERIKNQAVYAATRYYKDFLDTQTIVVQP